MLETDETTATPSLGGGVVMFAIFAALATLAMGALLGARFAVTDEEEG